MELVIEIAGWIAAGALLCAYGLLSNGRLSGQGWSFQSLNVVGSLLVGTNSLMHEAWPSVSVNVVWLVIGVATLFAARRPTSDVAMSDDTGAGDGGTYDETDAGDGGTYDETDAGDGGTYDETDAGDGRTHDAAGSGADGDHTRTTVDVAARTDPPVAIVGSHEGTSAGGWTQPMLV